MPKKPNSNPDTSQNEQSPENTQDDTEKIVKGKKEVAESRSATELEALGFNAYINKDYQKALEFYEKVLEIDPNFPGVKARIDECNGKL